MDQEGGQLRDAGLPSNMLQLLASHNLRTCRDVLLMSHIDLMELLNITYSQADQLLVHIAMHASPAFSTALQLHSTIHEHSVRVLTGLPELDTALRIGLPPGAITEFVGPAGVGKSQMCYGLALQVALPRALGGLEATLMYIDTEGKFSSQRLLEMASARLAAANAAAAAGTQELSYGTLVEPVLNRMLVMRPKSAEELQGQLENLKLEVSRRDIKLILLDSVAALLRSDFGGGSSDQQAAAAALAARGELLGQQAAALKVLAETHHIPVVVTNQVTARPSGAATHTFQQQQQQQRPLPSSSSAGSRDGQLSAALGTKWAHAVNVRIIMERLGDRRFIKIAKSPISANHVAEYCITAAGLQQVYGGELPQAMQQSALEVQIANEYAAW